MDYFLIGKTLKHSLSPQIYEKFGINYEIKELSTEKEVEQFVKSKQYKGFNITIPYKQTVMKYLDEISEEAIEIGAVNTVLNDNGILKGFNTDISGMTYAINKAGIKITDKTVAILGSGGTSKTAQYMCKKLKAKKTIVISRTGKINYENCYQNQDIQVIINTTPVGMIYTMRQCPINIDKFENLEGVFDAIYNPLSTKLVLYAQSKGLSADNGLTMLVEQARVARNIYLNNECSINVTNNIKNELDKQMRNIILIGMPGCGKSSIGKKLAEKLNRNFIDTDKLIEERVKMSISEIFKTYGEDYFRNIEREIIEEVSKNLGCVIATGGGAVLNEQNVKLLKASGKFIYIKRDVAKLALDNRPLSNENTINDLFSSRNKIYTSLANDEIDNNKQLDFVVNDLLKEIK